MKNVNELMNGLLPITIDNFKVDKIAYIVPYWNEFNVYQTVFPVKILYVGKKKVRTVAPPVNLERTGVGYRKTFTFNLVKREFYWDKTRDKERAEFYGELLTNTTLKLDNQYCGATVLLPSIEYVYILAKGMNINKFYISNSEYDVLTHEKYDFEDEKGDMRLKLIDLICKTGMDIKNIADELGVTTRKITRYLYSSSYLMLDEHKQKFESNIEKYLKKYSLL